MKDINEYIKESSGKHPGIESIEVVEAGSYGYMYYDPNSGIVGTYGMNDWEDMVDEFGVEEDWAKRLQKLKVGQSIQDRSGSTYTRIW